MENDSIRSSGSNTLVDIWVEGKVRAICVSQAAIGAYLGFEEAEQLSERDRCDFVRNHLPLLVTAARKRLGDGDVAAESLIIDVGDLPRPDGRSGDRRKSSRRKGERRTANRPTGSQPDRRKGDRRQRERRTSVPPKE
jgi:hypothetical protein